MSTTFSLISQNVLQSETHEVRFDNIPQNFKDLYLIASMDCNTTTGNYGNAINIKFNGRTDLFSSKVLEGYASTLTQSTQTTGYAFRANNDNSNQTANTFSINELHIPDYSRSDNVKLWNSQCVAETNNTSYNEIVMWAGKWNNTNPITSISIYDPSGNRFKVGCSFYLYGIKNSSYIPSTFGIEATGGDEVISNGYKYHVFKSSGTFNVTAPGWVEYLTIAGGASGGSAPNPFHEVGGGGGAGGYVYGSRYIENGLNNVLVGAGGPSRNVFTVSGRGLSGSDSSIGSRVIAIGGGGGGGFYESGVVGGSGGGGGGNAGTSGAAGISGQGNSGGNGTANTSNSAGGGGGGAGSGGANASGNSGGSGGAGSNVNSSWASATNTGVSGFYAGGGGGSRSYSGGANGVGGSGGGGNGGGGNGVVNTGSGGGGNFNGGSSGAGGSGIVIIRYPVS